MAKYRMPDGSGFSHASVERALQGQQDAGMIRSWKRGVPPGANAGTRQAPLYVVVTSDGYTLHLADIWEAVALVHGIASARHAVQRQVAKDQAADGR